jgi:Zn-dependent M28 family amino/carboxypeptidase
MWRAPSSSPRSTPHPDFPPMTRGASDLFDADGIPWGTRVRAARQLGASVAVSDVAERPHIPVMILNRARREAIFPGNNFSGSASLALTMRSTQVASENVVAVLPGSDAAGEYVAFVAHLDHVGIGTPVKGDAVYNGAVDNASGVAALLSIAAAFSHAARPSRSLLFLATTGEELGEIGSNFFVKHGPIRPADIVAAINIDGASIVPSTNVTVGGGRNPRLRRFVEAAARTLGWEVRLEPLDGEGSDHVPFARADVPSLWVQAALPDGWMDRYYHTPQDDITQPIDFTAMARYAQFNFLAGLGAANGRP